MNEIRRRSRSPSMRTQPARLERRRHRSHRHSTALARVCSSSAGSGTLAVLIGPVGLHGSRILWALALITVGVSSLAGFVVYQLRWRTHCCILV